MQMYEKMELTRNGAEDSLILTENGIKKAKITKGKKDNISEDPNENIVFKLERYLKLRYEFRYNEVLKAVEYTKAKSSEDFIKLDEERELPGVRIELAKKGFKSYKAHLSDLIKTRSFSPTFHPFKSYFESLPHWKEGDKDYIKELCKYVKVKDSEWFELMLKKHLVRTAACGLRLLDFNKHCFTLQGKQNDGKTSFIRFLSPPMLKPYYKENPPLDNKDSMIALGQNLLINLDELEGFDKTDAKKVKSLFSQTDVKVRLVYRPDDIVQPRYASFFATINELEFLNDVTGNVRWLVFEILDIIHDGGGEKGYNQNININDVWAQVYALLNTGYQYHLAKDEIEEVNKRNKNHEKSFLEKELVERHFEPAIEKEAGTYFLTSTDILQAIQIATVGSLRINPTMIGRACTALGFFKAKRSVYGYWMKSKNLKISEILENNLTILPYGS
jgi:predicted P-loop ATPase